MPDAPRFAHQARDGLLEVPVTTLRLFGRNLPASGGGYFRLLPYALSRWLLRRVNARDGQPAIFYFHPWEIDPEQPRVAGIDAQDALPPLPQPRPHGTRAAAACSATSRGGAWTRSFLDRGRRCG